MEEVGSAVKSVKPGQFVVGSFATSDNTCANYCYGYQSSCVHREFMLRAQAPFVRVPLADGTLVPTTPAGTPAHGLIPSLLAASDVLGTGWFAADAANVKPGGTGCGRRRGRGPSRRARGQADGSREDYRNEPS